MILGAGDDKSRFQLRAQYRRIIRMMLRGHALIPQGLNVLQQLLQEFAVNAVLAVIRKRIPVLRM